MTGHNGLLGRHIKEYAIDNAIPLTFYPHREKMYPELINFDSKTDIVHCGATLNEDCDQEIYYKKNFLSTKQIVDFLNKNKTSRLLYISANSLGSKEIINKEEFPEDKYNSLKYKSEQYIREKLDQSRYIVIRLPGLYQRGMQGHGFLDKVIYSKERDFKINSNHIFNNIALASDVAKFIVKLLNLKSFPGYLGNIGSSNPLYLKDLFTKLIELRPEIKKRIKFVNSKKINDPVDFSLAMRYGFKAKDTFYLAKSLYEKNY